MSEVNFRRAVLILLIIFGVSLVAKTLTSLPGRVGRHPEKKTSPSEREQRFSPPERAARAGGSLCGSVVPAEGPVYTRLRQEDHVGTPMARFFPPPKDIGGREQHPIAVSLRLSHGMHARRQRVRWTWPRVLSQTNVAEAPTRRRMFGYRTRLHAHWVEARQ